MKIKIAFKRRQTVYITILACAASLWMMVSRFGVSPEKLLTYLAISVGLILVLILIAALIARGLYALMAAGKNNNNHD